MPAAKKLVNIFFSLVLITGLLPVTAFASPDQGPEENANGKAVVVDQGDAGESTSGSETVPSNSNEAGESNSPELDSAKLGNGSDSDGSQDVQSATSSQEDSDLENSWRYTNGVLTVQDDSNGVDMYSNDSSRAGKTAVRSGIDVSEHNGTIDWDKVKADGVDFAILRIGFIHDNGRGRSDYQWERNVSECERLGIPYGVYVYSYAETASHASTEADFVLQRLKGHNPSYPVYYDLEDNCQLSVVQNHGMGALAQTFCSKIAAAGYTPGVYANTNWWTNYLTDSCFGNWEKWVAQYNSSCTYKGNYSIWQYTSSGHVDGIDGRVDMNFDYEGSRKIGQFNIEDRFAELSTSNSADIQDGEYLIQSKLSDRSVIQCSGLGSASTSALILSESSMKENQRLIFERDALTHCYRIKTKTTSKYLGLSKSGNCYSSNVVLRDIDVNDDSQLWIIQGAANGTVVVKPAINDSYCLDVAAASTANGTPISLYKENESDAQRFSLLSTSPEVEGGRTIADGVYTVAAKGDSSKVLDVADASSADGANLQLWTSTGAANQKFRFECGDDGFYTITCLKSGKVLDVADGNLVPGSNVQQWSGYGGDSQKWAVREDGNGGYLLVCKANGLALDLTGGSTSDGANVQSWTLNGTDAQSFEVSSAKAERTVADGVYVVSSAVDPSKVLDIEGGSSSDRARLQVYGSNMTQAQRFAFSYDDETGFYTITNVGSSKVLDAAGGSASNGTAVQQYSPNGTLAQRWIVSRDGDGLRICSAAAPSQVLDLTGRSTADGAKVQLWESSGGSNQRFSLLSTSPEVEGGRTIADGVYTVAAKGDSSKVLDVADASSADGANLQLWTSTGAANQKFRFECGDDGFYTITCLKSGKVLDVADGNLVPGSNVQQWSGYGGDSQKWAVREDGNGGYLLVCKANGLALDLTGGSTSDGANVQSWTLNGTDAQSFEVSSAKAERTVADGVYVVSSAVDPSKVLDIEGGSSSDRARLQVYGSNMTQAQRFAFSYDDETGFYTITNVGSSKVLDAAGGSASNGTAVQQYSPNGTLAQRWIVSRDGDGLRICSAAAPSQVLDLTGRSTADGAKVQLWESSGGSNQRFSLYPVSHEEVPPCSNLGFDGWFEMAPSCQNSLRVDVEGASREQGAGIQLYSDNSTLAQLFRFEYVDGYYRILSANSGDAITFRYGSVVPGIQVCQMPVSNGDEQLFSIVDSGNGAYCFTCKANGLKLGCSSRDSGNPLVGCNEADGPLSTFGLIRRDNLLPEGLVSISSSIASSKVLDVENGSFAEGANVQLYDGNGTFAQKWNIEGVAGRANAYRIESVCSGKFLAVDGSNVCQKSFDSAAESMIWIPSISAFGGVVLENAATAKVLDVSGASTSNGANIQIYGANGTDAQRFFFESTEPLVGATYAIHSGSNYGQVIDVSGGSSSDGANIQIWASNNSGAQKWNVYKNNDGSYRIINAANGKALDVPEAKAYAGANIQQYTWNGSAAQKWVVKYGGNAGFVFASLLDSSLVLEVSPSTAVNGANIQLGKESGQANQRFSLEKTTYIPPMPSDKQAMQDRIWGYGSGTQWLIAVDRSTHKVGVFRGSENNWSLQYYWSCVTGAPSTPTITGTYRTTGFKRTELSTDSRARWCTQIWGGYFFHTILASENELGQSLSHGCLRMSYPSAQWIYNNIYAGTTVAIYN